MYGLSNGMITVYHKTANPMTLSILQGYLSIAIPFANRICVQHDCRMGHSALTLSTYLYSCAAADRLFVGTYQVCCSVECGRYYQSREFAWTNLCRYIRMLCYLYIFNHFSRGRQKQIESRGAQILACHFYTVLPPLYGHCRCQVGTQIHRLQPPQMMCTHCWMLAVIMDDNR